MTGGVTRWAAIKRIAVRMRRAVRRIIRIVIITGKVETARNFGAGKMAVRVGVGHTSVITVAAEILVDVIETAIDISDLNSFAVHVFG